MKNKKVLICACAAVVVIVLAVLWATGVFNGKAPEAPAAVEKVEEKVEETAEKAEEKAGEAADAVKDAAEKVEEKAEEAAGEAAEAVTDAAEKVEEKVEEAAGDAAEAVKDAAEQVGEKAEEAAATVAEEVEKAEEKVEEAAAAAEETAKAEEKAEEAPAEQEKKEDIVISIPNDATNEGRALLLLQAQGLIKLKADAGITATVADIEENKLGLKFNEVEAAMVPNVLADSDYAVINGNYALAAGLAKALLYENSESPYVNVVCVNEANKDTDQAKALAAAVLSQQVVDYFAEKYKDGSAIATIDNPTDGYDASVDYEALAKSLDGKPIKVACTLDPHSFVLEIAKKILAEKNITLEIVVVDDYVTPNTMVDAGDVFANYFAHQPYQDNFNAENGTKIVTIAGVHVEPMGLYAGKQADLGALGLK